VLGRGNVDCLLAALIAKHGEARPTGHRAGTDRGRARTRQIAAHRSGAMLILVVVVRAMKPSKITTPIFGHFEGMPAVFDKDEAWVLYGDAWREIGAFEVSFSASLMSKTKFEKTYGTLPALPGHAFANPNPKASHRAAGQVPDNQ
jgi:hypothetical protein